MFSRQPNDDWYFALYNKMAQYVPESYYFWSVDESWEELAKQNFTNPTVLLLSLIHI